ncbi:hypothetical protein NDU88_008813 [Pleurodeles waltl]|uniref:Uncharacterized protein n=1 Tax=Pleurodeles waltl TaxID=8319 RepID=A0AAV7PQ88_PLEWA|nr:hypothetical protein NDU88_008813 [Pleurodeles waltl]
MPKKLPLGPHKKEKKGAMSHVTHQPGIRQPKRQARPRPVRTVHQINTRPAGPHSPAWSPAPNWHLTRPAASPSLPL